MYPILIWGEVSVLPRNRVKLNVSITPNLEKKNPPFQVNNETELYQILIWAESTPSFQTEKWQSYRKSKKLNVKKQKIIWYIDTKFLQYAIKKKPCK